MLISNLILLCKLFISLDSLSHQFLTDPSSVAYALNSHCTSVFIVDNKVFPKLNLNIMIVMLDIEFSAKIV